MPDTNADPAQLAAILRGLGLIPPDFHGEVVVNATTGDGTDSVTITV
jgi:hypothetical protein